MPGKILLIAVCVCLLLTAVAVFPASAETLDEYKERMKREQEEADRKKREDEKKKEMDRKDKGGGDACLGDCLTGLCRAGVESGFFESIFRLVFLTLIDVRYADYPFAPSRDFDFSAYPRSDMTQEALTGLGNKFWMVEAGAWGSYLFGQNEPVLDFGGVVNVELAAFHFNVYYQHLMSVTGSSLDTFSANAGFSLPLGNFIMNFYAGALWQEWSPWYFSFGASGKIFIPGGFVIGWYTLFAFSDGFFLIIASPDVGFALGRFTIGVGFNYYNYNNYLNFGPVVKTALWF